MYVNSMTINATSNRVESQTGSAIIATSSTVVRDANQRRIRRLLLHPAPGTVDLEQQISADVAPLDNIDGIREHLLLVLSDGFQRNAVLFQLLDNNDTIAHCAIDTISHERRRDVRGVAYQCHARRWLPVELVGGHVVQRPGVRGSCARLNNVSHFRGVICEHVRFKQESLHVCFIRQVNFSILREAFWAPPSNVAPVVSVPLALEPNLLAFTQDGPVEYQSINVSECGHSSQNRSMSCATYMAPCPTHDSSVAWYGFDG